jgi:ferredoxin
MAKHTDPAEDRAVFVDENTCIGCKQCVWHAPATFRIEDEYGRSRVYAQWLDPEDKLQDAIGECRPAESGPRTAALRSPLVYVSSRPCAGACQRAQQQGCSQ